MRLLKHEARAQHHSDTDDSASARVLLEDLLRRRWRPLVAYVAEILGGRDEAEDIAQEAFIRLWSHAEARRSTDAAVAFLYRVAHNLALNERRRRRVRFRWREAESREEPITARPDEATELHDLQLAVAGALADLTQRRREVFLLVRQHGLTHRQVSEALGIAPQTVSNHMASALEQLRVALAPFLGEPSGLEGATSVQSLLSRVAGRPA